VGADWPGQSGAQATENYGQPNLRSNLYHGDSDSLRRDSSLDSAGQGLENDTQQVQETRTDHHPSGSDRDGNDGSLAGQIGGELGERRTVGQANQECGRHAGGLSIVPIPKPLGDDENVCSDGGIRRGDPIQVTSGEINENQTAASASIRDRGVRSGFVAEQRPVDSVAGADNHEPDDVELTDLQPAEKSDLQVELQPVAKKKKQAICNGLQRGRKPKDANRLHPPQMKGHSWRPDGHSGWDLWRRIPTVSANGKPSSKHTYIAYYSRTAVQRLQDERAKGKAKTITRRPKTDAS